MKSWADLRRSISNDFSIIQEEGESIVLRDDGHEVDVYVDLSTNGGGLVTVQILVPVGDIPDSFMGDALTIVGDYPFGGLVQVEDIYCVRHGVFLHDLTIDGLPSNLGIPAGSAAELISKISELSF